MKVIGVTSRTSNSGKTTVVEKLVEELKKRGYSIATVKHIAKDNFTVDKVGSDTWRHARAGAELVVGLSDSEAAFILKEGKGLKKTFEIIEKLGNYDFVIVEGFKKGNYPKIIVAESIDDIAEMRDDNTIAVSGIVASRNPELDLPVVDVLKNPEKLADILDTPEFKVKTILSRLPGINCTKCGSKSCAEMAEKIFRKEADFKDCVVLRAGKEVEVFVGGNEVPLGSFVQGFVKNIVLGMVDTLKKTEVKLGDEIVIKVRLKDD